VDLLEAVAAQIGGPIASTRLYQEAQLLAEQVKRRNEHLTVLNAVARMAVSTLDVERMLAAVTEQIQQGLLAYGHVELYTVEEDAEVLKLAARAGTFLPNRSGYRQPLTEGLLGRATIPAAPVSVDDVLTDAEYLAAARPRRARRSACRSWLAGACSRCSILNRARRAHSQ